MNYRTEQLLKRYIPGIKQLFKYIERRSFLNRIKDDPWARSSLKLWSMIPAEEKKRVFKGTASAEIEPEYLGNIFTYENLAAIIPLEWTVIDIGCSYNPQAYLFQNHLRHIAVDYPDDFNKPGENFDAFKVFRFTTPNCKLYEIPIQDFVKKHIDELDLDTTFAICNWVPDREAMELVRKTFPNLFVMYPASVKRRCKCGANVSIKKIKDKYYYEPHMSIDGKCGKTWTLISKEKLYE